MTTTTDPTLESHSSDEFGPSSAARVQARTKRPLPLTARMKALQSSKIREVAEAVKSAGFLTLDEQAKALGLSRSTAWTIRKASHKASGLSASIINRMLAAPERVYPETESTLVPEYDGITRANGERSWVIRH
jgi:response regulator of citrate/malate metabolism